jgi:hypothetical protein
MPSILNATTSSGLVTSADNSGSLQLATNNGTTAVTITTAQNVGIGTASPISNSGYGGLTLNGTSGSLFSLMTNGTETGRIASLGNETSVQCQASTGYINFVQGVSGGTERMRVSSSGQLLVGVTSAGDGHWLGGDFSNKWALVLQNTNSSLPNGFFVNYNNAAPNNTARDFFYATDSSALRFSVRSNGGIQNYSANNSNLSDAREKTNIELAGSYLDKICAIPVKTFNYIDQNRDEDDGLTLGVIAQDVQAVAPELVMESNWASKDEPEKMRLSIYQTDLQYALMKAIQELNAKVDAQALEIQALKGVA